MPDTPDSHPTIGEATAALQLAQGRLYFATQERERLGRIQGRDLDAVAAANAEIAAAQAQVEAAREAVLQAEADIVAATLVVSPQPQDP